MVRMALALAGGLFAAEIVTAQNLQPGALSSAAAREAARLAVQAPAPRTAPRGSPAAARDITPGAASTPSPETAAAHMRRHKALAAWSGVVLSAVAGWPPTGPPAGISRRDSERVNCQHATIDGYFTERIARLFAR